MYSAGATVAFATVITLMMLFTIVGNILVITAILTSRALRRPQNLFLISLAVADILVASLVIPFSLAKELLGYWYFHLVWCEIHLALDVLFCTSSIIHLCAISLDRYMSVTRPLTYRAQRTSRCIKCTILIVWVISAVISLPPLLPFNMNQRNSSSSMGPNCQLNNKTWYILYSTIGSFFVPCLIMIFIYLRIYQIVKQRTRCSPGEPRKEDGINVLCPCQTSLTISRPHILHQGKIRDHPASSSVESSSSDSDTKYREVVVEIPMTPGADHDISDHMPAKVPKYRDMITTGKSACHKATINQEKRFTFVLTVVIGVFVVCWFPFFFSYSLKAVCPEMCRLPQPVFTFFFWMGYCNSCLNPVIYTIFNKDFRRAFKRILSRNTKGAFNQ